VEIPTIAEGDGQRFTNREAEVAGAAGIAERGLNAEVAEPQRNAEIAPPVTALYARREWRESSLTSVGAMMGRS
jgi:hypothetical protein